MIYKILAVDDSFEARTAIEMAFSEEGYVVRTAPTAEEGLRELKEFTPDLVVSDLRLPGMDGFEFCTRVRELSTVPIIVMSIAGEPAEKLEAFARGADDYVVKGAAAIDELVARARVHLRWLRRQKDDGTEDDDEHGEDHGSEAGHHVPVDRSVLEAGGLQVRERDRPTTVLLADPDATFRRKAKIVLQRAGFRVLENNNGRDAIITIASHHVDVVVLDAFSPVLSGFNTVKLVREWERTRDMIVIVLSALGHPRYKNHAATLGVSEFIVKPVEPEELTLRVRWSIDRWNKEVEASGRGGRTVAQPEDTEAAATDAA